MDKQLKCFELLTLKELSTRWMVVLLFRDSDISASILKFSFDSFDRFDRREDKNYWKKNIEANIVDKITNLAKVLPKTLLPQMIEIAKRISLETLFFLKFHQYSELVTALEMCFPVSAKLTWTSEGALNCRKMAEDLVRCGELSAEKRYALASNYCLVDVIPSLWNDLPENRRFFYSSLNGQTELSFCWPHLLNDKRYRLKYLWKKLGRNLTSFNQWAFEDSVHKGNKMAAEYFYQKLTYEEKGASLLRSVKLGFLSMSLFSRSKDFSDVLRYLMSLLSPKQQMEVIVERPMLVWLLFFDWHRQSLFLENAPLIWPHLPQSEYTLLLFEMKLRLKYLDPYYPKFFLEFFTQSPPAFKTFIVNEESKIQGIPVCEYLCKYFDFNDEECVVTIFRCMDAEDRVKLVLNDTVFEFLVCNMKKDKWREVKFFLVNAKLSSKDKERVKDHFIRFLIRTNFINEEGRRERLLEILEESS